MKIWITPNCASAPSPHGKSSENDWKALPMTLIPSRLSTFPESGGMKEMTIWIILDCGKWAVSPCAHDIVYEHPRDHTKTTCRSETRRESGSPAPAHRVYDHLHSWWLDEIGINLNNVIVFKWGYNWSCLACRTQRYWASAFWLSIAREVAFP